MKRYSPRQIKRILRKYDTRQSIVEVNDGVSLSIVETADAYALLDRLLEREDQNQNLSRFPYWAEIWPAAIGLSRWFSAHPPPPGREIVELGCGLGLVGIALAKLGCRVEATDFVEDALVFTAHNADRNGVRNCHSVSYLDWSHPAGKATEFMVGSDVAYEKQNHLHLSRLLRQLLKPGGTLFISDPSRPAAQPFIRGLVSGGYGHEQHSVRVAWGALEYEIDIHVLTKPAG